MPGQQVVNGLVTLLGLAAAAGIVLWGGGVVTSAGIGGLSAAATATAALVAMAIVTLLLGVAMVMPIGGADMPVVISLLNSFSGLAAAAAGFVICNNALIISGALVGASGLILTNIMCKAMNRSLANVLFGAFGVGERPGAGGAGGGEGKVARSVTADEAAILLAYAQQVVFVPGYGLAVAQAQQQVRELATILEGRGVEVKYGIHPVAGRMPGHMNVLLAEANVPYDRALRPGPGEPGASEHRRRPRGRRQRRGESGGAGRARQPDLRHADHRRRQGRRTSSSSSAASIPGSRASTTNCSTCPTR